jgi:hypothetical protein
MLFKAQELQETQTVKPQVNADKNILCVHVQSP